MLTLVALALPGCCRTAPWGRDLRSTRGEWRYLTPHWAPAALCPFGLAHARIAWGSVWVVVPNPKARATATKSLCSISPTAQALSQRA